MQKILIGFCVAVLVILGFVFYMRTNRISIAPMSTNTIETESYTMKITQPVDVEKKFPELFVVTKNAITLFEKQYTGASSTALAPAPYDLQIDTFVATTSATVSYVVSIYEYTGGAHGGTAVKAFTYDRKGKFISEKDLFGENNWRPVVSEIAYQYLKEKLKENTTDEVLKEGTTPIGNNLDVWYLKGDDIVFVFGQYQIGPYALGIQAVLISKEKLSAVLSDRFKY